MFGRQIIIYLGADSVRGALFSSFFGRTKIEKTSLVSIDGGGVSNAIEAVISAFPADAPITLILPGHLFMVRDVNFPFSDRKKIRKAIPFELEGIVPFSIDELFVEGVPSHAHDKGNSAVAISIQKKTVADYIDLFPKERRPARVLPDFISLLALGLNIREEKAIYGVLDVGEAGASIVILYRKRPLLTRSTTAADTVSIASWIESTLQFIEKSGEKVEMVYAAGISAQHVIPLLKERVNISTLPASGKGMQGEEWPLWACLAGAAMASREYPWFNILGAGSDEKFERLLKMSCLGAAIVLLLGTGDIYMRYRTASQRYQLLKNESKRVFLSAMPSVKNIVKEDAQLKDALNREKEDLEAIAGKPSPSYTASLKGIERIFNEHPEIVMREMVFEGEALTISGDGTGIEAAGIKRLFTGMEGAKDAVVEELTQGTNPNSYLFRIKVELKK